MCKRWDCGSDQEVLLNGKCVKLGSLSACPEGMEVLIDPFGKGEKKLEFVLRTQMGMMTSLLHTYIGICSCIVGSIPYRQPGEEEKCYQQFLQVSGYLISRFG